MDALRHIPLVRRGVSSPYRIALPRTSGGLRSAAFTALCAVLIVAPVAIFWTFDLRVALTDSSCAPGIYHAVNREPSRGDLVLACLPENVARFGLERGYLARGRGCGDGIEPVGKVLAAVPGDTVEIAPKFVAINGKPLSNTATISRDSRGNTVTHLSWGLRRVQPGQAWLIGGSNARSWDSRYFGSVPLASIRSALEPIVTW